MPYITGSNTNPVIDAELTDLQQQITNNLNSQNSKLASISTQIKQVTLSLEGSLNILKQAFVDLKAYVLSKIPN